jgi:hypothetical protein
LLRKLVQRIAVAGTLAASACSAPVAPGEDVGNAAAATTLPSPVLGPSEAGWRLPPAGDYNRDGIEDLIWRDHTNNRFQVLLMQGTEVLEQGPMLDGPGGEGWKDWVLLSGFSDRNLDGLPDILWYNWTTHHVAVWLMAGFTPFERGPEIAPPSEHAYAIATGDMNRDGMSDLLWYDPTTGLMTVWFMRGTGPFDRSPEIPGPGTGWYPAFATDFDRDGLGDVMWHNPDTGRVTVWLMNGFEVRERGPEIPVPSGSDWILASAGDFNRDSTIDVVWYNTRTYHTIISFMFGTQLLEQSREIPPPDSSSWVLGNSSDVNGDGIFDMIWFDTNPLRMRVWLMDGTVRLLQGPDIPGPE